MVREGEIESVDDQWIRDDGGIYIVSCGIQVILLRECVHRSHLHSRGYFPDNVKILEKEGPASLMTREFAQILEVGQVLMVSEDRDRMWGALQVLFPFAQSKDDSEKLAIIVTILFPHHSILLFIHTRCLLTWRGRHLYTNTSYLFICTLSSFCFFDLSMDLANS